ncbi:ATP-dependent Clp protease proteolytic subunit [Mameliella alba]|nr:ATP-dependent Clp protease proteolytic subunit [Mameliella alba]MBY6169795.1 ATP-dependent Clp protease proteolytic subunit [Mameliella alba]MBY6174814.1 ATP-dependent Clp protease proteolytic subunit [Mameliella alba]
MSRFLFQLTLLIVVTVFPVRDTQAAEFTILPVSPFESNCWLEVMTGTIVPGSFVREAIPRCETDTSGHSPNYGSRVDTSAIGRSESWQFWDSESDRPALGLDGAWSYQEIHDVAAVQALANGRVIRMDGTIQPGDADRFESFLRENNLLNCLDDEYCPHQNVLALDSPGGSLGEALKIADMVQRYDFPVLIPADAVCASSCSFVFFAGYTEYESFFHNRRFIHETGRLMVHRPRIDLAERAFSTSEVRQIVEVLDEVKEEAIRQFLQARIPRLVLLQMYETASEDLATIPLAQMTGFATVIGSTALQDTLPDRHGILSFCAFQYYNHSGRMHPDLLKNLEVRDESFATWIDKEDFLCFGARLPDKGWVYDACHDNLGYACALMQYAENELPAGSFTPDGEFPTYGALLASYPGRGRHDLIRAALSWSGAFADHLPRWVNVATVPRHYCGALDIGAPQSTRRLQAALNARGYDAGPVDGMMGGRTVGALAAAASAAGQPLGDTITQDVLRAIGVAETDIEAMRLCQ